MILHVMEDLFVLQNVVLTSDRTPPSKAEKPGTCLLRDETVKIRKVNDCLKLPLLVPFADTW